MSRRLPCADERDRSAAARDARLAPHRRSLSARTGLGRSCLSRALTHAALALTCLISRHAIARTGGPDAYGYTWRDTNEVTLAFAWEDISATGTVISSGFPTDDANYGFQPLSFPFPYYGNRYSRVAACSNGWVSVLDGDSAAFGNRTLPSTGEPRATIAAYWDDLSVPASGDVRFQDFGDHAVIQWTNVQNLTNSAVTNTFQIVLRASGVIDAAWLRVDGPTNGCTIGIESPDDTAGLTAWLNASPGPPTTSYMVEFSPPPPLVTSIDCASAPTITCGDVVAGDLATSTSRQSQYGCLPATLDGAEDVYRIDVPSTTPMRIWLETISGNPELVLLDGCDANFCLPATADAISSALHAGTWYAVVDCRAGQEGAYRLHSECLGFTFCGNALLESSPSVNPEHPSWNTEDGSWLVEGWLYHPFDADDNALRVDAGRLYDDRGSPGCTPFPSMTHGVLTPTGPAFTQWSCPEATLRYDLSPTSEGGCCGLRIDMTLTNADVVPHFYDIRIFYDTAFGNAVGVHPGCSFVDAVDGGPIEVAGTRYVTEQDLKALGGDTCEGQVRMFTAEDPTWLRSSWEMLGPNLPTNMEFIEWGDGDYPALQWSGFYGEGALIGDCIGDNSLLLIWRVPSGSGTLAPGESSRASLRIGWGCSFPCVACGVPVLSQAASHVDACRDGVLLTWDPATFPGAGNGAYHVYRSPTSFADALANAPVATGLLSPSFTDSTAIAGTSYWYIVQAESLDFPGCGLGPQVGGSTDEIDVGPVLADPDITPPVTVVGSALRATAHTDDTVDFNWLLAPPPDPQEHYVVLRSDDRPMGPFSVVARPVVQTWTDPSAPPRFVPSHCWFYDIRIADKCENMSSD